MPYPDDLLDIARAIAKLVRLNIEDLTSPTQIDMAIDKMVVSGVVARYTLLDDILGEIIIDYFVGSIYKHALSANPETDKLTIFTHHILDEMYLLKKMEVVHAIDPLPKEVTKLLRKINALRNALAHSFFPENRKEYRATGKLTYADLEVRTPEGLSKFLADSDIVFDYLYERANGPAL